MSDKQEPVAWAVIPGTVLAGRAWRVTLDREEAEQLSCGAMLVVPLYEQPQPTLTDAEREAVGVAIQCVVAAKAQRHPEEEESHELLHITAVTLRGLLERLA